MTPWEFRTFLIVYAAVYALNTVFGRLLPLHEGGQRVDLVRTYLATRARSFIMIFGITGACFLLAGAVGFAGLFIFWAPAVYIFMVGTIGRIVLMPVVPVSNPQTKLEDACAAAELFLAGMIVALTLFGPAEALFR